MHLKSKNYFGHLLHQVQGYTDFHIFIKKSYCNLCCSRIIHLP